MQIVGEVVIASPTSFHGTAGNAYYGCGGSLGGAWPPKRLVEGFLGKVGLGCVTGFGGGAGVTGVAAVAGFAESRAVLRSRFILASSSGAKKIALFFITARTFPICTIAFSSTSGIPSSAEASRRLFIGSGMEWLLVNGDESIGLYQQTGQAATMCPRCDGPISRKTCSHPTYRLAAQKMTGLEAGRGELYASGMMTPEQKGSPVRVDPDLRIETPENVVLTYPLAGPAVRLAAYFVDFMIRVGMVLFANNYILGPLSAASQGVSTGMLLLLIFVVDWLYYGVCETLFRGKTIGKHFYDLRVIQENGSPVSFWGAMLRNIIRAADSMPLLGYGTGFVTMLIAGKFRRLGDLVARTMVIQEHRVTVPREPIILEKIEPLPRNELGGYVPTAQMLAIIEEFLGRRQVLTYRRGHEMASVLAEVLARRLNYHGNPELLEKYPMAFLARVYATFYQVREGEESGERGTGSVEQKRTREAVAV